MSSIIHQSSTKSVVVIDIPTSIAEAQRFGYPCQLASCKPQLQPWPSTEPKSAKAKSNLAPPSADELVYQQIVKEALDSLRASRVARFCLSRWIAPSGPTGSKRQRSKSLDDWSGGLLRTDSSPELLLEVRADESSKDVFRQQEVGCRLVTNTSNHVCRLGIGEGTEYFIPPGSSFFLSDCGEYRRFHQALQQHANQAFDPAKFEAIVMDPPWPNRSVNRSGKSGKAHYEVAESMWELRQLLFDMDVSPLMAEDGVIAVWITNRPAARELVLSDDDGLFSSWGVKLIEEWVWVKVTERGEPVLPVDGLWRKPYEVLLVGRKCNQRKQARGGVGADAGKDEPADDVKRRVLFAVPDLHSRKPCLQGLLHEIFSLRDGYRGLEVFARNLTSGWTSWGNEALKFNDVQCWHPAEGATD